MRDKKINKIWYWCHRIKILVVTQINSNSNWPQNILRGPLVWINLQSTKLFFKNELINILFNVIVLYPRLLRSRRIRWFKPLNLEKILSFQRKKKSTHTTNKHEVIQKQIQRSLQSHQSHQKSQEMSHQSDFNQQQWMGRKMRTILGVIFKTICYFPRSFVSSVTIELVLYSVYNELFTKGNKKETGRKKEKTKNKKGLGKKKEGLEAVSVQFVCLGHIIWM